MASEPPPLPSGYIAAIDVPTADKAGPGKRLGVEVSCQGQSEKVEAGQEHVPVVVELFTSPPTLSIGDSGVMQVEQSTGRVTIATESGEVRITGQLADDRQSITGQIEVTNIHFMEIAIDQLTRPIELAGFEEQS